METEILRAFHNDAAVQEKYLARVRAHRAADELVKGETGRGGKGCAVWCTLDAYEHIRYPIELGIPVELATLEDFIFENLPDADAMAWPERFLSAPKLGADLRLVWDRLQHWLLTEEHPDRGEQCARMGMLFARRIAGDEPNTEEWDLAARAAWDARAARAARDARDARAAWDAWTARDARNAWDARDARNAWTARAAWDARDARNARAAYMRRLADKLIDLMGACQRLEKTT